jgi:hypothetical protein
MAWKYVKSRDELTVDLKNINDISSKATITHVHCDHKEVDGFNQRMRECLGVPDDRDHPLLV